MEVEGIGGEGTGLAETGGQASSQQLMPPTAPRHHFLLMYRRNTRTSAPRPATRPSRVLPSVPEKQEPLLLERTHVNGKHFTEF